MSARFAAISGEMAERIRTLDWSNSPLGPMTGWTPTLISTVSLMLPAQAEIVLFWGPDYIALYNDAYAPTIGDKHPRALGRPARENWTELWDDLEPLLRGVRETGQTYSAKDRPFYIERDGGKGETVYFDISYSAVRESDGSIGGVLCIVSETTQRVRAETGLRRSEEQLRLATENAGIGLWDIDRNGGIALSYSRDSSPFTMPQDRRTPMADFLSQLPPEDAARVRAAYDTARDPNGRPMMDVEYRILPSDGTPMRWVKVRGRGVFDAEGNCLRVSGTALDITRERETQQALARSEALLRLASENAEIGMWDMDVLHNIALSTPRVKAMFGMPADSDPAPDEFFALVHPQDIARVQKAYAAAFDPVERAAYDIEYRVTGRDDGVERWIHAKGRGVFDSGGTLLRVTGTAADVTARKAIERQLHELNETLEKRVAERTAALEKTQAALQQAQKMEAIGNLTGGIAHDFNNLLQGLTGSLDLIRNKPQDTERVRRWAEAGLQAAERGAKLTAQLLAFSRAQKLELKPLALNRLLEEMRDLLGRTLGPSVQVTMDLAGDAGAVLGDETQLEMSVLNLAINARDAMPDGGTLVIVTRPLQIVSDPQLQPGDYVELRVSDSGMGMPPDIIARAFDPFFTTKGVGKGTGLGLSQVYGMAQQAGGTARIGSEPGKGTSVSIFLRVTDDAVAREIKTGGEAVRYAGHTATVLVIDDDPDVRAFLAESLDAFGYAVTQAQDGPQGLALIAKQKPDILLVDYAMPGMTGAEVAARVRKIHADLPIIFASGYAETAALENVRDANTAILRKPFRLGELQEAVANALRR
jgi:PAS domain S-box-containing protein